MATKTKELTARQKRERMLIASEGVATAGNTTTVQDIKPVAAKRSRAQANMDYLRKKAGWPALRRSA